MNDSAEPTNEDQDRWLSDDLEEAYQKALAANSAVEWEIGPSAAEGNTEGDVETVAEAGGNRLVTGQTQPVAPAQQPAAPETLGDGNPAADAVVLEADRVPSNPDARERGIEESTPTSTELAPASVNRDAATNRVDGPSARAHVTAKQVVEAALFVGGAELTTKRLSSLLSRNDSRDVVEQAINELNTQYTNEARPYEIVFGTGGYRMTLRPEYERLRNRIFGLGPKDVRLSQEALQVLALVAYRQPVGRQELEEASGLKAGKILGQLLRRELIVIRRDETESKSQDVRYLTTARFLSLFGLGNIDELPQIEDLEFK